DQTSVASDVLRDQLEAGVRELEDIDAVSMLVVPGTVDLPDLDALDVWRMMIAQTEALRDRVALLDPPANFDPQDPKLVQSASGLAAIYWPWIKIADERPEVRARRAPPREVPPCGHIAGTIARRDLTSGLFAPPANLLIEGALGVTHELMPAERNAANEA